MKSRVKKQLDSPPLTEKEKVDQYLDLVAEPAQSALRKLREAIRSVVPDEATEKIAYQIPAFYCQGPLVSYAAFKSHCSFFPMSSAILEQFQDEAGEFQTSTGTLRFTPDQPLPLTLVKKIVKARLKENQQQHRTTGKPSTKNR